MNVYLVSLGCAKNQVDSEIMQGRLVAAGLLISDDPATAQVIIVNTCSFIEDAADEAIDTILELARHKQQGQCQRLIVCGCLPERYREELAESLPEVDLFLGTGAYDRIVEAVTGQGALPVCLLPKPESISLPHQSDPRVCAQTATVYIKISEGCNRHCTYCIIPRLRGKQRSREVDDIIIEARQLVATGARELVLVAQETSAYGQDLPSRPTLAQLLRNLSDISGQIWIRLLYLHPQSLTIDTIETIGQRENICNYFDIPIQHASTKILKRMGRHHTSNDLKYLFKNIKEIIPGAALRTTTLVGFPGETDADFEILLKFIKKIKFDHLGVFVYSDNDDLSSHALDKHVPKKNSEQRYDRLMSTQADISLAQNVHRTKTICNVLIEEEIEKGIGCGRTWFQAPEVDGLTYFNCRQKIIPGKFIPVRLTSADQYDLTGEVE